MSEAQTTRLQKELRLPHVVALATGATLSAGLFLLPGIASQVAGPAIVLCYIIAAIPLVPATLCAVELATAMPRAGGAYYFIDRSLGPLAGTVGGVGTWLALTLKPSFALVGMGAYVALLLPDAPGWTGRLLAVLFALTFGLINLVGSRKSGRFQVILLTGLIAILVGFLVAGVPQIQLSRFAGFFDAGSEGILATAGLVYISYVGVTNVASVSEEVRDPNVNLPRGVFISLGAAVLIYALCTSVLVGVVPMHELHNTLTPMATAGEAVLGRFGMVAITIAALFAFSSVANAGILSSSRYPLAMSRDQLLPEGFKRIGRFGTPTRSIVVTVATILFFLLILDPTKIAKLASAFQLLMFSLLCLAVVVMREAHIDSYDPGYRAPFYPWLQIFGILSPFVLIAEMGVLPVIFSAGLIGAGVAWFILYASKRVKRFGAIYHVFERLGRRRHEELDSELREILKEKGLREDDPFDYVVAHAAVLDLEESLDFEELTYEATGHLSQRLGLSRADLVRGFMEGTRTGATPVAGGVALPHLRLSEVETPHLVLARCREAITIPTSNAFGQPQENPPIHAVFFLLSPEEDPGQHLRMLAQLASRVDQVEFVEQWMMARSVEDLRRLFLRNERYLFLLLEADARTASLIDKPIYEVRLPEGCLIATIRRKDETLVPHGGTTLHEGDRLMVIGSAEATNKVRAQFEPQRENATSTD